MLSPELAYSAYVVLAAIIFWSFPVRSAILLVVLGGWIVLPPADYPETEPGAFPWWITGLALPADMLVSKAWIPSTVAMLGALMRDGSALRAYRANGLDVVVGLWCLLPLAAGPLIEDPSPGAVVATLYLTGSWGASWMLGRLWFGAATARITFLKALVWSGVACLPFAVLEGTGVASLHDWLYGPHPFQADGASRYVGFRPLGMFEHGNQYGLWVSVCAMVTIWLTVATREDRQRRIFFIAATLTSAAALAAQSVGAILLVVAALSAMALWRGKVIALLLALGGVSAILLLGLHLSGVVPLEHIARNTAFGQGLIAAFDSVGRGSFLWRLSQDFKSLPTLDGHLVFGTGHWDWWRVNGTRPWGLWLLLIGQFGLISILLSYTPLVAAAVRTLAELRGCYAWREQASSLILAMVTVVMVADSLFNAFLFFPAFIAAGAIAWSSTGKSRDKSVQTS